jgi:hypothetical protein
VFATHHREWRQDSLEREIKATRQELEAMRALLDELPGIFESRFATRLNPLLSERDRLIADTEQLRQTLLELQSAAAGSALLSLSGQKPRPPRIQRALRHAFGLQADRAA